MTDASRPHRNTIFVEDAVVLAHTPFEDNQYILRLQSPKCAAAAVPGSFVHLTCDPSLPMRRPLSIMRVDARAAYQQAGAAQLAPLVVHRHQHLGVGDQQGAFGGRCVGGGGHVETACRKRARRSG